MNNKNHFTALAAIAFLTLGGVTACATQATSNTGRDAPTSVQMAAGETARVADKSVFGASFVPAAPRDPVLTVSQRNAVRSAEDYLDLTAFSRQGLIDQLKYSDFSTQDATFAVDHISVDWNEQAAKAAEDYLEISGFSRGGLISQLEYAGFTTAQAVYGVTAVGL